MIQAALRQQLRLQQPSRPHGTLALAPEIDAALAGGLARGNLHDVAAGGLEAELGSLAAGFIATLLARLAGPVIWIARICDLYPPGLLAYGLDPGRIVFARAPDDAAALAGMETALRGGAATAVVAEVAKLGRLSGRRLQLACLKRGSTGFLLRRFPFGHTAAGADSFAVTRWCIAPAPSQPDHGEPGPPRWHIHLLAARGGTEGDWIAEPTGGPHEQHTPYPLRVVPGLADRAATPVRRSA